MGYNSILCLLQSDSFSWLSKTILKYEVAFRCLWLHLLFISQWIKYFMILTPEQLWMSSQCHHLLGEAIMASWRFWAKGFSTFKSVHEDIVLISSLYLHATIKIIASSWVLKYQHFKNGGLSKFTQMVRGTWSYVKYTANPEWPTVAEEVSRVYKYVLELMAYSNITSTLSRKKIYKALKLVRKIQTSSDFCKSGTLKCSKSSRYVSNMIKSVESS